MCDATLGWRQNDQKIWCVYHFRFMHGHERLPIRIYQQQPLRIPRSQCQDYVYHPPVVDAKKYSTIHLDPLIRVPVFILTSSDTASSRWSQRYLGSHWSHQGVICVLPLP